jgi:hypothetical protein
MVSLPEQSSQKLGLHEESVAELSVRFLDKLEFFGKKDIDQFLKVPR